MRLHYIIFTLLSCLFVFPLKAQITESDLEIVMDETLDGDYYYVLEAKKSITFNPGFIYEALSTDSYLIAAINPHVVQSSGYSASEDIVTPSLSERPLDTDLSVGNTPASFSVNQGAATYSIPIKVAPGTAGVTPSISINYSSYAQNSNCGYGWTLSANSVISRVGQSIYYDDQNTPVSFSSDDRFVLDGQRLIVSNDVDYGVGGAEYKIENDNFSLIESYNINSSEEPEYFIVTAKNGTKSYYGYDGDNDYNSYIKSKDESVIVIYYLYKVEDIHGNYMIYNYTTDSDNKEAWLTSIEYTGNSNSGLEPYNEVVFTYEDRDDKSFSYIQKKQLLNYKILKTISTYAEGDLVKKYQLQYYFDKVSKLNEIYEFNSDNERYNSIVVGWGDSNDGLTSTTSYIDRKCGYTTRNAYFGDFNGDGLTDHIFTYYSASLNTTYYALYYRDSSTGFTQMGDTDTLSGYEVIFYTGDFDADGKTDVLFGYDDELTVLKFNDEGFDDSELYSISYDYDDPVYLGDFDADGKTEFWMNDYLYDLNSSLEYADVTSADLPNLDYRDNVQVLDINGDGKTEIVMEYEEELEVYQILSSGANQLTLTSAGEADNWFFGYFNNDNYIDILQWSESDGWTLRINSNGTSFFTWNAPDLPDVDVEEDSEDNTLRICDMTGDGISEVIFASQNESTSSSTDFTIYSLVGLSWEENSYTIKYLSPVQKNYRDYLDLNGDGLQDIIYYYTNDEEECDYKIISLNASSEDKYVTNILDGQNNQISIAYEFLNSYSGYEKGSEASYPLVDYCGAFRVVSAFSKKNSSGTLVTNNTFAYSGLKIHVEGKGFIGYDEIVTNDVLKNRSKTDTYDVLSNYYTYLKESTVTVGDEIYQKTTCSDMEAVSTTGKAFWIKDGTTTTIDYLLDKYEETVYNTYDDYGNPTSITKTIGEYSSGTLKGSTTTLASYTTMDGTNYPNVTSYAAVTNTSYNPSDSKTRTINYYYNSSGVDYQVIDAGSDFETTIDFTYDSDYGVLTKKEIYDGDSELLKEESFEWDDERRFKTKTTNALGHSVISVYEPRFGKLTSQTNASGQTISYTYNNWGLNTAITTSDGVESIAINWYTDDEFEDILCYRETSKPDGNNTQEFFDVNGRACFSKITGLNGDIIYTEKYYDNSGNVIQEVAPYKEDDTKKTINYTYDEYDRVTLIEDNTEGEELLEFDYSDTRTVKVTDLLGNKGTSGKEYDVFGQTVLAYNNAGEITYEYDCEGNPVSITSPGGEITMTYDLVGNKTSMTSIDDGTYNFEYDLLGQLTSKTHALHGTTSYEYDEIGRILTESSTSGTITYDYYSSGNGLGQVAQISSDFDLSVEYDYVYDEEGRIIQETETLGSDSYSYYYEYDDLGRIETTTFPDGFEIVNSYDNYGNPNGIINSEGDIIWQLNESNASGQVESIEYGNGLTTDYTYNSDQKTELIKTYNSSNTVQQLAFSWDHATGNLLQRSDEVKNLVENFTYDDQYRLISYNVEQESVFSLTYNDELDGVIQTKSGVGEYVYNEGSSIHAYSSIIPDNPNLDYLDQYSSITYTCFNKTKSIVRENDNLVFYYGPDFKRKKVDNFKDNKAKLYIGDLFEIEDPEGDSRELHYIPGPDGEAAIYVTEDGTDGQMFYIHKDNLGSYQTITDENGDIAEYNNQEQVYSFDPWGRRRNADTWTYEDVPDDFLFARGFTGHEHLDEVSLINMNGRLYDPYTATFLSVDPYIQMPDNPLNFNRYGYCFNNPLIYTDPSGEFIFTILAAIFAPPLLPIAIGADIGMYVGGAIQQGNANPLQWDYSDGDLYKGMTVGAIAGAGAVAGVGALAGASFTSAAGWGSLSSGLLWGNLGMAQSAISDLMYDQPISLDGLFESGVKGFLMGGFNAGKPMTFGELVLTNNIADNLDVLDGEDALSLHFGPIGWDFEKGEGFYTMFDKGITGDRRADMGMESLFLLSFIPDFSVDANILKPYKEGRTVTQRVPCLGGRSVFEGYRSSWSVGLNYQGQQALTNFRDWTFYLYKYFYH